MIFNQGYHTIEITVDPKVQNEIKIQGLRVFTLCTGIVETVKSIITLIKFFFVEPYKHSSISEVEDLFFEDHETIPEKEQKAINFYIKYLNITPELRVGHEDDILDVEQYVESGDYFGTTQFCHGLGI